MSVSPMSIAEFRSLGHGKGSKHGNKKTTVDGRTFDSKLEAKRYEQLKLMKAGGQIDHFLCQVPLWIAPGVRYVVDFQVVWKRYQTPRIVEVTYEDVKGHLTDTSRVKIRTVEHLYGIKINILTKKEIGA